MQENRTRTREEILWGIAGTGQVATNFASQLSKICGGRAYGVASRSPKNAEEFAERYNINQWYEGIESLCADPDIDAVYLATPTRLHRPHSEEILKSGKALLCEKPFARNFSEAKAIVECAREQELFCMEAMWMRFNPLIQYAKEAVHDKRIGTARTLSAELGYRKDTDALGTAEEGRGALLAFGCYGVSLALFLFGPPVTSQACWLPNSQGGDETAALTLHYDDVLVSFRCSEGATLSNDVEIQGTEGCIQINSPFIDATTLELINVPALQSRSVWTRVRDKLERITGLLPSVHTCGHVRRSAESLSGFRNEAQEATDCIQAGRLESSVMPLEDTLTVHRILDATLEAPVSNTDWTHEL